MSSRKAIGLGVALLLALVVAASALAASRSTNSSAAEPQVLNVWDYGASPKVSKAFNSIWREFEKTHPGVTIKRRSFGGGTDFDTVFTTAMAAGKGPDIWTGTVSSPNTRVSIKRGLVLDLTPYYCKYNWDDKLARNQIGLSTVKSRFYGVPDGIESLVVFYNKDVFRQLGVGVPKTWAQLQQINAKAKAKGLTPISLGNIEKWPGTQWISALVANGLGAKGEENLLFGNGHWTQPGVVGALQRWVDLSKAGAFPKASISMSFDEGISLFARKKAPMFFIGSFVLAGPTAEIFTKPNVGVFLLPSWNPKVPTQATESSGNGWIVNSKTKNPALAAAALNHLLFNPASQRDPLRTGRRRPGGKGAGRQLVQGEPAAQADLRAQQREAAEQRRPLLPRRAHLGRPGRRDFRRYPGAAAGPEGSERGRGRMGQAVDEGEGRRRDTVTHGVAEVLTATRSQRSRRSRRR